MNIQNGVTAPASVPPPIVLRDEDKPLERRTEIEAELTRLLYSQAPAGLVATLLNASMLVAILRTAEPLAPMLVWLTVLSVLTGGRALLVYRHRRLRPAPEHEAQWRRWYHLGVASVALTWGAAGVFLFPPDLVHQVFMAFVFAGMSAGAVTILSSVRAVATTFITLTLFPLAIQCFVYSGEIRAVMGIMILLFSGVLFSAIRHLHATTVAALELRFSREELSDRLRAQTEKAATSETRFRELFENASDGIAICSCEGINLEVNRMIEELLGYQREELLGHHFREFMTPESAALSEERMRRRLAGERLSALYEIDAIGRDGRLIPFEARARFLRDAGGTLLGFQVTLRDITERKQAETTLRESEQRYRDLFENASDGIATFTLDGMLTSINRGLEHMLGWSREEMLGHHHGESATEASSILATERTRRALAGEKLPSLFELELLHKNGNLIPVDARARLIRNQGGLVTGVQAIFRDITARKQTEAALRESEERFRLLFEAAPDAFYLSDLEGCFIDGNHAAEQLIGYRKEDVIGKNFLELGLLPDDQLSTAAALLMKNMAGETTGPDEFVLRRSDGQLVPVEIRTHPVQFNDRRVVLGIARDVTVRKRAEAILRDAQGELERQVQERTEQLSLANQQLHTEIGERRRAEEALQQRETYFRTLIEDGSDLISILREDGALSYVSPSHTRLLGYTQEELLGQNVFSFLHPADAEHVIAVFANAIQNAESTTVVEFRFRHKDGSWRTVESIGKNLLTVPTINGIVVNSRDITERKHIEETIRVNEERFRALMENSTDVVMILDAAGTIRYRNPTVTGKGIHGYVVDELIGRNVAELIHPDDRPALRAAFDQVLLRPGLTKLPPFRALHTDGSWRYMEGTHNNLLDHPVIAGVVYTGRDITERRQAELALVESEARYRALIESTHDLIQSVSPDGQFLFVNDAWSTTLGYTKEEAEHLHLFDVIHPDFHPHCQQMFAQVLTGASLHNVQVNFVAKDGTVVPVEGNVTGRVLDGHLIATHGFFRNMSERQRAEKEKETLQRQLNQAQKLESLGTLAGGIAHDFNNLLTPIIGFTELLKYKFTPETLEWNNLQEIAKAGQRAKELVKQMLAFGRPGPQTLEPVALNHVVEDCLVLLRAGLPTTVEIHTTLESVYGTVLADPTQLHQVVMNLSVNALHAMEGQVGTLSIAVEQTIVDAAFATLHPPLVPGRYQKLIVRDTGSGIPPAVLPSIFDPFFTTKPIGKGSGLGLAVVHGIVTSFGGAIVVDSVFGKGTTFTIYLPLSDSEETIAADESQPLAQGRGRILIVDDDPTVMLLTTQMLETLGYDVTPVPDSQKALDQFRLTPHQFDMVMTDQLMPGLRGTDLAIAVRALHPTIPIVICSGSNTEMPETLLSVPGKATWLKKPFTLDQLGLTLQGIA